MAFSLDQHRPTQAVIHLDHLRHNLKVLESLSPNGQFFCPMVKANAYGHGDVEVARVLEEAGVTTMGVGLIEEGVLLRGMGIQSQLLFFGTMDAAGAKACLESKLTIVLNSWDQLKILEAQVPSGEKVQVHIKFDTGMHRLGFEADQVKKLVEYFHDHPEFDVEGVLTHLHSGEDASDPQGQSFAQLREFDRLAAEFEAWAPWRHTVNSAGLLNLARLRKMGRDEIAGVSLKQGSRPGLALYGLSPLDGLEEIAELKPVMSLMSKIVRIKKIPKGEGVSYGHRWKAERDSWIGIVPVGYADGYHRLSSNRAEVLCDGKRVPVIGNVTMDYFMIDLTGLVGAGGAEAFLWKEVTLFGYDSKGQLLSPHDLAKWAQTIPWEILTSVGERVPRVLKT